MDQPDGSSSRSEKTQPALDWNQVYRFADQLERGSNKTVGQTMTQIDQYVLFDQNGAATKQEFMDALTVTLQRDRMLGKVLNDFTQSSFQDSTGRDVQMYDYLRRGHHRMSANDLTDDTLELNSAHRAIEARLTQEMIGSKPQIESAHYEGVFLGIGGPVEGIDNKRLNNYAKNETKTRESENILSMFGIDSTGYVHHTSTFNTLSRGKSYITKEDVQQTLLDAALHGSASSDTITTLQYMRDNFKKLSDTGVDSNNPDERGITVKKLVKYAQKNHANLEIAQY